MFGLLLLLLLGASSVVAVAAPNVLVFVVDDLNDWNTLLDRESPIRTPNLQRLAQRGTLFTRAYCASPACNPSRVATWTGLRPTTSGVYGNKSDWRSALPNRATLMQRFRNAGYEVCGAGKIFHHHLNGAFHDTASFDEFQHMRAQLYPPRKLNGAPEYGSRNTDWGAWPEREQDSIDFRTADYCIRTLKQYSGTKPLFLTCGIFKPHSPFFAPERLHERYQAILPPERSVDDWDDLPSGASQLLKSKKWFWKGMDSLDSKRQGSYRSFIQSYAACVSFADEQVGRVLDALDQSPRRDDTIVVLWSDHGFHLGEKDHIEKFALWEKTNHIPFIVAVPGVTKANSECDAPVDMSCLYPTLLELCGLASDPKCDGLSVVPLLKNVEANWSRPALMSYMKGNHAVRSRRWRYIRYNDGSEELYDHARDPREWKNLAAVPEYQSVIESHRNWLPKTESAQVRDR